MKFIAKRLYPWACKIIRKKKPGFVIGESHPDGPYLKRWYIIPRNRFFNIYLHQIIREDDPRALHDHPWISLSLCISGFLRDQYQLKPALYRDIKQGDLIFRRAKAPHRLEIGAMNCQSPITLFFTGPIIREWGFVCPQGWVHWKIFTGGVKGEIGPGCD